MSEVACASGVDLLMDYLEGVLPAHTVAAVEGHVTGCDRCQAFIASYRATPQILRHATNVSMPSAVQSSLRVWLRKRRGGIG